MDLRNDRGEGCATLHQAAAASIGAALLIDAIGTRSPLCSTLKALAGGASLYWAAATAGKARADWREWPPEELVEMGRS